jgi:hypothetical protein
MRQDPKVQQIRSTTSWVAAEQGVLSKIAYCFCHGLASTVLTFGPGNLGHSSRQRALGHSAHGTYCCSGTFCCCYRYAAIARATRFVASPGLLVVCLGAAFFCLPRGSSAAGAGPSWVGGARAMPSGEIWGGNGAAAGALIGLTHKKNRGRHVLFP